MARRAALFVLLGLACLAAAVAEGDVVTDQQSLLPENPVIALDVGTGEDKPDIVSDQQSILPLAPSADDVAPEPEVEDLDPVADLDLDTAIEEEESEGETEQVEGSNAKALSVARELASRLRKLRLDAIRRRGMTRRLKREAQGMKTAGANRATLVKQLKDDIETLRAQEIADKGIIRALRQKLEAFTNSGKSQQAQIEALSDKEDDILDKLANCRRVRRSSAGAQARALKASLRTIAVLKKQLLATKKQYGPLKKATLKMARNRQLVANRLQRALKKRSPFARGLPLSCADVKRRNPKAKSGVYTIAGGLSKLGKVPKQCQLDASGRTLYDKLAWRSRWCSKNNGGVYVGAGRTSYELLMTFPVSTVNKGQSHYAVVGRFWLAAQTRDNDPKFCLMNGVTKQKLACACLGDRDNHRAWIIGGNYNPHSRRFQSWKTRTSVSYHRTPTYAEFTWTVNGRRTNLRVRVNGRNMSANFNLPSLATARDDLVIAMFRNDRHERFLVRRAIVTSPGTQTCEGRSEEDLEEGQVALPVVTGVWAPRGDAGSQSRNRPAMVGNPVSIKSGSGYLLNPNPTSGFGMHDHHYRSSHVPNAARARATFRFSKSVIVSGVSIAEHTNGVDVIEGFAGDSRNRMVSVGIVSGSLGRGKQFREKSVNVFAFPKPRAGKFFRIVVRHTVLRNGWALYNIIPKYKPATASPSVSGPLLFMADYYNSYSAIHPGIKKFFENSWSYMRGASSHPTVATLSSRRDGFSLTGNGHNPAARNWFRQRATIRTINVVSDNSLKDVDVFHIVMDSQGGRSRVPTLSVAEAKALKRFVKRGGAVYAFLGHQAERRAPHCGRWAKDEFGVIFDENSRCMSPGRGRPVGAWPTGFSKASVHWNSNCHENFNLAPKSRATVLLRATGRTHCGHTVGGCNRSAINEAVIIKRGAYRTAIRSHALGTKKKVYCDMETAGGGWTLCLNSAWDKKAKGLFQKHYAKYYNNKPYGYYDFCPSDKKDYMFGITNSEKGKLSLITAGVILDARPHESGSKTGTSEWNEIGVQGKTVKWVVGQRRYVPRCQVGSPTLKFWEYINPARRRLRGFKRGWFQCQGVPSNAQRVGKGITYKHNLKGRAYYVHAHYWQWMMGAGCNYQTCSTHAGGGVKGASMHPSHWNYSLRASAGLVNYSRRNWQSRDEGNSPAHLINGRRFLTFYREAPRKEEEVEDIAIAGGNKQIVADLQAVEKDPYAKNLMQLAEACAYSRGNVHRAHCRRMHRAHRTCQNKCQSIASVRRLLGRAFKASRLRRRIRHLSKLYAYLRGSYGRDAARVRRQVIRKWRRRRRTPRTRLWPRRIRRARRRRRRIRKNYGPDPIVLRRMREMVKKLSKNAKVTGATIAKMVAESARLAKSKKQQLRLIALLRRQVKMIKSRGASRLRTITLLRRDARNLNLAGLRLNKQLGLLRVSLARNKKKAAACEANAKKTSARSRRLSTVRNRIAQLRRALKLRRNAIAVLKRRLHGIRVSTQRLKARHARHVPKDLGSKKSRPARSCNQIIKSNPGVPSGKYWLKIRGIVRHLYCDMTTDGGGWTLVYKAGGSGCDKLATANGLNIAALKKGDLSSSAKLPDADINAMAMGKKRPFRFVTSDESRKFFWKGGYFSATDANIRRGNTIKAKLTWSSKWRTGTQTVYKNHGSCYLYDKHAGWSTKSKRHAGEHICMRHPGATSSKCRAWMNGGMWNYKTDTKHRGLYHGSVWIR